MGCYPAGPRRGQQSAGSDWSAADRHHQHRINHQQNTMSSTLLHQGFLRASLKPVSRLGVQASCFKSPLLGSLAGLHQQRFAGSKTLKCSEEDALKLLNEQRKLRPSSPHFTIYEPQLTWYSSIANRVTGCALSAGFYAYALGYMAMSSSIPLDSDSVVQFVASSPEWAKVAGKAVVALPFTYHTFNGVRHLAWDMGYLLDLKTSYTAGYTVLGLTAVSTVGLALI